MSTGGVCTIFCVNIIFPSFNFKKTEPNWSLCYLSFTTDTPFFIVNYYDAMSSEVLTLNMG